MWERFQALSKFEAPHEPSQMYVKCGETFSQNCDFMDHMTAVSKAMKTSTFAKRRVQMLLPQSPNYCCGFIFMPDVVYYYFSFVFTIKFITMKQTCVTESFVSLQNKANNQSAQESCDLWLLPVTRGRSTTVRHR